MSLRVIIIHGSDRYLSNYYVQQALAGQSLERITLGNAENADQLAKALRYELSARSLFGPQRKAIIVQQVIGLIKPTAMAELLNHPTSHLVIWLEHQKIPQINRVVERLTVPYQVQDASVANHRDLQTWGQEYARAHELAALPATAWPILLKAATQVDNNRLVYSAGALAQLLDKVALLDLANLSPQKLQTVVQENAPVTVWQWLDTVFTQQQRTKAYLRELLTQGTDPSFLFNLLADHVRSLLIVAALQAANTPRAMVISTLAKMGKPPFLADKLLSTFQSARLQDHALRLLHHKITNFDRQVKQGQIEPTMALELLLLRL